MSPLAFPKPEKRQTTRARKDRMEHAVKQDVRGQCVDRDGYCRLNVVDADDHELLTAMFGRCAGPSEWAHLGPTPDAPSHRRSQTRGQEPEVRHTTAGSLMFCRFHHGQYDTHAFDIEPQSGKLADGALRFVTPDGESYTEAP